MINLAWQTICKLHPNRLPPVLRSEHPTHRPLGELISRLDAEVFGDVSGITICGVTNATADLRPGEVFVAIQGRNAHGAQFAQRAAELGAKAIVTDAAGRDVAQQTGLPVLVVENPRAHLGRISAWAYGTGADDDMPTLLGVTGSNGKTSTTHIIDGILAQLNIRHGLSSTAERHINGESIVSRLTTPEAPEMHALLALMREHGVEVVAIEVSAQSLTRNRVDDLVFDVAGFASFSRDHLDDYTDMNEYLDAKVGLFTPERARKGVINLDSFGSAAVLAASTIDVTTILTPAIAHDASQASDWVVSIDEERADGTVFTLTGPTGSLTTLVPLIGAHMAANAGLAIVMLVEGGISWELLKDTLESAGRIDVFIPGRTQAISSRPGPVVYVDFGHSTDAFEKTLAAVRKVTSGKVLMLFGADGDRDWAKRPDMARAAVAGADIVVVTDHHPRFEDAASIRETLVTAAREASESGEVYEVSPPEDAIVKAVSMVGDGDAILWAGPGHQDYRDIQGVRTPYSARELARRALKAAGWDVPPSAWPHPYGEE